MGIRIKHFQALPGIAQPGITFLSCMDVRLDKIKGIGIGIEQFEQAPGILDAGSVDPLCLGLQVQIRIIHHIQDNLFLSNL